MRRITRQHYVVRKQYKVPLLMSGNSDVTDASGRREACAYALKKDEHHQLSRVVYADANIITPLRTRERMLMMLLLLRCRHYVHIYTSHAAQSSDIISSYVTRALLMA